MPVSGLRWRELLFLLSAGFLLLPSCSGPWPSEYVQPSDRDQFLELIANTFGAPDLCSLINSDIVGGAGFSNPGFQISSMQSDCFLSVAHKLHDPSLCGRVTPVRTLFADGSKKNPQYCREHIADAPLSVVPDPYRMDVFVRFVRRAGINDSEVAKYTYQHHLATNNIEKAYDQIRDDPRFLQIVKAGPRAADSGQLRRATSLEYLYQKVGVDTASAPICEKISTRAVSGRNGLLRFQCLWYVAVNSKDRKLCKGIPEAKDLSGMNTYEDRSGCYQSVAVEGRNGTQGLHYGPERFPEPADWQEALRALGATEFMTTLPPPSADEYWDFLSDLAKAGDSTKRSQFLQRVRDIR